MDGSAIVVEGPRGAVFKEKKREREKMKGAAGAYTFLKNVENLTSRNKLKVHILKSNTIEKGKVLVLVNSKDEKALMGQGVTEKTFLRASQVAVIGGAVETTSKAFKIAKETIEDIIYGKRKGSKNDSRVPGESGSGVAGGDENDGDALAAGDDENDGDALAAGDDENDGDALAA